MVGFDQQQSESRNNQTDKDADHHPLQDELVFEFLLLLNIANYVALVFIVLGRHACSFRFYQLLYYSSVQIGEMRAASPAPPLGGAANSYANSFLLSLQQEPHR